MNLLLADVTVVAAPMLGMIVFCALAGGAWIKFMQMNKKIAEERALRDEFRKEVCRLPLTRRTQLGQDLAAAQAAYLQAYRLPADTDEEVETREKSLARASANCKVSKQQETDNLADIEGQWKSFVYSKLGRATVTEFDPDFAPAFAY